MTDVSNDDHPNKSSCKHEIVFKQLCAQCGQMVLNTAATARQNINQTVNANSSATVAMVHSSPHLFISQEKASELARSERQNLLKNSKLVLLLDLDQTIIHTTFSDVDPAMPDVHHFQLEDKLDPGNPKSGKTGSFWYHTSFRPGLHAFLDDLLPKFELHIASFGTRQYANAITKLIDPDGKYFGDRILSRDEIIDKQRKTDNLNGLFPEGTDHVVIVDDRTDVWHNLPNVIQVKPYIIFKNTGDINALGLSKSKTDQLNQSKYADLASSSRYLILLKSILLQIHEQFFRKNQNAQVVQGVNLIMNKMRQKVLRNYKIIFDENVFPPNEQEYWLDLAHRFGANSEKTPTDSPIIFVTFGNQILDFSNLKQLHNVEGEISTVNFNWFLSCIYYWKAVPEDKFIVEMKFTQKVTESEDDEKFPNSKRSKLDSKPINSNEQNEPHIKNLNEDMIDALLEEISGEVGDSELEEDESGDESSSAETGEKMEIDPQKYGVEDENEDDVANEENAKLILQQLDQIAESSECDEFNEQHHSSENDDVDELQMMANDIEYQLSGDEDNDDVGLIHENSDEDFGQ